MNLKSMSMDSAELNAYAIWEAIEGKRASVRLPVENTRDVVVRSSVP